jgi:DedD protein
MAWFKFGKQDQALSQDAPLDTVESLRLRAKRRLIGALVLVAVAVVGFPLLFDTQPRPTLVDVPIEIPDKNKAKPLALPPLAPASAAKVDDQTSLGGKEEIVSASGAQAPAPAASAAAQPASRPAAQAPAVDTAAAQKAAAQAAADKAKAEAAKAEAAKAEAVKAEAAKAEAAKAKALLEGKSAPEAAPKAAADGAKERFVVQFGSFAESAKTQEVRRKVEAAGLKTYAQVAETSEGKRHRARVGPFATRAEAEKAAAKIKSLGLPANILTL